MNKDVFAKVTEVSADIGDQKLRLQTGRMARQADGAVLASVGDIRVLATVVARREVSPTQSFFPLTVNYQERMYATGRIPGSFFRREGRPTDKETLTCRLIDRPIRPLFPAGFRNEVQVICTVLSAERDNNPDIASIIATSAALMLSGVPFAGPIGACRIGFDRDSGQYLLNPTETQLASSALDMVVAGTEEGVLMVESEASELSEEQMLGAVNYAHEQMQTGIGLIRELLATVEVDHWPEPEVDQQKAELEQTLRQSCALEVEAVYAVADKAERGRQLGELRTRVVEQADEEARSSTAKAFDSLAKATVRNRVLAGEPRIDGRAHDQVRPIDVEVGLLPGAHGSALFTRGETQALVTTTLGPTRSQQLLEGLGGIEYDRLLFHYNFPPFSVGETGFMGGPKRREIGHGRLARRGIEAVLPAEEDFPYTIRIVSDITESNGSSSMASACGASMALMDTGVPISRAVAGVAMGLVKEGEQYAVLTDILGDEDHLGDMDFKVIGTEEGITALQMDIKISGISEQIMADAVAQARKAQLHILSEMNKAIAEARPELSDKAPKAEVIEVAPDQVRLIIGKGGSTIKALQQETGAEIEISDEGQVTVYAETPEGRFAAIEQIRALTAEATVGEIYKGKVERIMDFGAFVNILPGKDGLVHISEIAHERVARVQDYLSEGDEVEVKVLDIDERGRVRLSMKALIGAEDD